MVRAVMLSVALALAAADSSIEHASLLQTQKTKNSGQGSPTWKDADLMTLLDALIAHPQSTAAELVGAAPSVQQALVQRANEKPRRHQILERVLSLDMRKKLELLQAAKTSPEVARLFHSLNRQTQLNLIEMAKADSIDAAMAAKDNDWFNIGFKISHHSESNSSIINCDGGYWFGDFDGEPGSVVTVVDPDIGLVGVSGRTVAEGGMDSGTYCEQNGISGRCTYIHALPWKHIPGVSVPADAVSCAKPQPPDYCHRYHKVFYSSECRSILNDLDLSISTIDTGLHFGQDGVLKECKDYVLSKDVYCWGPPADDTQECECPGEDTTTQAPSLGVTPSP